MSPRVFRLNEQLGESPRRLKTSSVPSTSSRYVSAMAPARRVLVIEDDEGVRRVFSQVLTLNGYSVQVAATADEALELITCERPDAILLELKMPFINSVGFLHQLRQVPGNQDIAVAVITGALALDHATASDLRTLDAHVWHKPLSIEDIQRVAQTLFPGATV
jgi:CheY-like chemotaxis protein